MAPALTPFRVARDIIGIPQTDQFMPQLQHRFLRFTQKAVCGETVAALQRAFGIRQLFQDELGIHQCSQQLPTHSIVD